MSRSSAIKAFVLIFIIFPCLVKAVLILKEPYQGRLDIIGGDFFDH